MLIALLVWSLTCLTTSAFLPSQTSLDSFIIFIHDSLIVNCRKKYEKGMEKLPCIPPLTQFWILNPWSHWICTWKHRLLWIAVILVSEIGPTRGAAVRFWRIPDATLQSALPKTHAKSILAFNRANLHTADHGWQEIRHRNAVESRVNVQNKTQWVDSNSYIDVMLTELQNATIWLHFSAVFFSQGKCFLQLHAQPANFLTFISC